MHLSPSLPQILTPSSIISINQSIMKFSSSTSAMALAFLVGSLSASSAIAAKVITDCGLKVALTGFESFTAGKTHTLKVKVKNLSGR